MKELTRGAENQELFFAALDNISNGIIWLNGSAKIIFANKTAGHWLEHSCKDLINRTFRSTGLSHPEKKWQEFWISVKKGELISYETVHKSRSGSTKPLEIKVKKFRYKNKPFVTVTITEVCDTYDTEKELFETRERFQTLIEQSPISIEIFNLNGTMIHVNRAWEQLWGVDKNLVLNKFNVFQDPMIKKLGFLPAIKKAFKGIPGEIAESRYISPDDPTRERFLHTRFYAVKNISGKPVYVVVLNEDITKRKVSEARFQDLVETSLDWIWETDKNLKYRYSSPRVRYLLGYEPKEILGKTPFELMPPADAKKVKTEFYKYFNSEKPFKSIINKNLRKDGTEVFLETSGSPIFDASGKLSGYRGIDRDITERIKIENALRESEQRNRMVIENANVIIWMLDKKLRFTFINRQMEKVLRIKRTNWYKKPVQSLLVKDSIPLVKQAFEKALKDKPQSLEVSIYGRDRNIIVLSVNMSAIKEGSQIAGTVSLCRDISAQKSAQATLLQSEKEYRSLTQNLNVGVYRSSPDGELIEANPALLKMFAVKSRKIMSGIRVADLYASQKDRDLLTAELDKEGFIRDYELTFRKLNGALFPAAVSAVAVKNSAGKIMYYDGIIENIEARLRAKSDLQVSEARYRSVVEDQTEFIIRFTLDGTLTFVNESYCRFIGKSRQDLIGSGFLPSVALEDREAVKNKISLLSDKEPAATDERRVMLPDGSISWQQWTDRALFDENDKIIEYQSIGIDITDRKLLEDQFRQAQKMEAIGRLAGGVAHDFNNILTVIHGYCEYISSLTSQNDPVSKGIEEIVKAADRAEGLTRQLLAFSRKQILKPVVIDLNSLLQEMQRMMRRLIGEDIKLVISLAQDLGSVKADPGQVEQVIMNLIVNAKDAMPGGGLLKIGTHNFNADSSFMKVQPGKYSILTIEDSGSGIDEETRLRIFEPFFTTKRTGKGTGLGLSTVYGIVKQSGGYIFVESEKGTGTVFTIFFPQVEEKVPEIIPVEKYPEAFQGTEIILVVEDEENLRKLVKSSLESQGYKVIEATNGENALMISKGYGENIDLILTDIVMPEMSGPQMVEHVKNIYPNIKVLFMSGYPDASIEQEDFAIEGNNFLQKPFSTVALLSNIREVLDNS